MLSTPTILVTKPFISYGVKIGYLALEKSHWPFWVPTHDLPYGTRVFTSKPPYSPRQVEVVIFKLWLSECIIIVCQLLILMAWWLISINQLDQISCQNSVGFFISAESWLSIFAFLTNGARYLLFILWVVEYFIILNEMLTKQMWLSAGDQ